MTRLRSTGIAAALLATLAACSSGPRPATGTTPTPFPTTPLVIRAAEGDTVYLIQHYIQPGAREQFESFVGSVLIPAFQADTTRHGREVAERVRLLRPVGQDADGAWVYTFVLDPVVAGERYDIFELLRRRYGDEDALRHYEAYTQTWQREFVARAFVQGRAIR